MIRLLLITFASLLFLSCEDIYTSDDELFYQISEADSVRCMEEILDGILEEARVEQEIQDSMNQYNYDHHIIVCGLFNMFNIRVNSSNQIMVQLEIDSLNISEKVFHYFMCNRFLSDAETIVAATNENHHGFEYPFYNKFRMEEINKEIDRYSVELQKVKAIKGIDSAFVDHYESKIEGWKTRKRALELIGGSVLPEISMSAYLNFEYPKESEKTRKVSKEITYAFYQMRNNECMRYFGESYLSLYHRYQRKKKRLDSQKLQVLKLLHPAVIYFEDRSKPSRYGVPEIPQPTP